MVGYIYHTSLKIMSGGAAAVLVQDVPSVRVDEQGTFGEYAHLVGLVASVESDVEKVFGVGETMEIASDEKDEGLWAAISDGIASSMNSVFATLFSLVLTVTYFIILVQFFVQIVLAIFRVLILAAFAPFLCLCYGFGWGRGMAIAGVKSLLALALVLFAVTAVIGLIMSGVNSVTESVKVLVIHEK